MAFYGEVRLNENKVFTQDDLAVGFTDYLGAAASDAWHDNPSVSLKHLGDVYAAQIGRDTFHDLAMEDGLSTDLDAVEFTAEPALSLEEQKALIRENGLEAHVHAQEGYNRAALDIVMENKRGELERALLREQAPGLYAPAGFVAGLGASMLDPINLASNFIPGLGQQRVLRMLGQAKGAWGRAGVRAMAGAVEGAVGAVAVEPLVYLARTQEQADYDMADSLLNIAFGTVMGATLHPAAGAIGDWKRQRAMRDNPLITHPWETVAPTDKTEELRANFARDAFRAAREAGADVTEEQMLAAAALFDARARTWAYAEKRDAAEYYEAHAPTFTTGREAGELWQGMRASTVKHLEEFTRAARAGKIEFWRSISNPVRLGEALGHSSLVINIPYNYVQHLDNKRPHEADALISKTEDILVNFDDLAEISPEERRGDRVIPKRLMAARYEGNRGTLIVFKEVNSKKRGNRVMPVTAYENKSAVIRGIIEKGKTLVLGPEIIQGGNIENEVRQGMSVLFEDKVLQSAENINTHDQPSATVSFSREAGELWQAMYAAREQDIPAFASRVAQEGQNAKKSYFAWDGEGEWEGWEMRIPSDTIFHQRKRHPDMTDADNRLLPEVITSLDTVVPSMRGRGMYGKPFLGATNIGGQGYGVIFEANEKGQIFITTFFKDSDKNLKAWLRREKKKTPKVPAASESESALNPGVDLGGSDGIRIGNLLAQVNGNSVNTHDQLSASATPPHGIEAVAQRAEEAAKRKAASVQPTGGSPAYPSQQRGALTGTETAFDDPSQTDAYILTGRGGESPQGLPTGYEEPFSESNIPQTTGDINTLLQRAWHGTPHRFSLYQGSVAEQKLAADVAAWEKTVDDFKNGKLNPRKSVTMLSQTPLVLSLLDARKELAVTTDYAKLKKILKEKHKLPEDVLKQVPGAMADPIMIFESATMKGDFVMMLDLKEETGATVVVPISLNYDGVGGYTVNYVPSVYAQKNTETNTPRNVWFKRQIEEGRLRYVNNKKSREWVKSSGLQLPRVGSHPINGKKKILTEADLVKLKEQFPGYYQPSASAMADPDAVAYLPEEKARMMGLPGGGKFIARASDLEPVDRKHSTQFKANGFENALEMVRYVLDDVQAVYKAGGNAYHFVRQLQDRPGNVVAEVEIGADGQVYRVTTAHPVRKNYFKNKTPLWESARLNRSEEPLAHISGQSGVSEANIPQTTDDINTFSYQAMRGQAETPRGSVTFNPEDGKAIVTFFKNTDASTLPHEMFHIFRRELAETAGMDGASPQSKDMWAKVCDFVGAKEGEPWTREQEEMFARAGERYLLEGKAPNAQLRGVFERMKQWFMEIYTGLDAAGMEISDTMRQVFGDMFKLSPEEADMAFRYGLGRMLEWDGTEGTDTAIPEMPDSDDPAMQEEWTNLAAQRLEESFQSVADMPEVANAVRAQVEQDIAVLDAEMEQSRIQGEILLEAALCDMRS